MAHKYNFDQVIQDVPPPPPRKQIVEKRQFFFLSIPLPPKKTQKQNNYGGPKVYFFVSPGSIMTSAGFENFGQNFGINRCPQDFKTMSSQRPQDQFLYVQKWSFCCLGRHPFLLSLHPFLCLDTQFFSLCTHFFFSQRPTTQILSLSTQLNHLSLLYVSDQKPTAAMTVSS